MARNIAHYQILEKLGKAAWASSTKLATRNSTDWWPSRFCRPDKVGNSDRKLRFIQEAKAASALNHPNIVVIHDIGTEDGVDFIVMEFVGGRTLDRLIPRGGLKLAELLKYAIPIADAMLARAHGRHRPSRPQAGQHHDRRRRPGETA